MTADSPAWVEFQDVSVNLGGVAVLERASATVPAGSITAVIGPNGAGKTTLILALLGQIPYQGHVMVNGHEGTDSVRLGYVPQRLDFDRGMALTVMEFMTMDSQRRPLWLGISARRRRGAMEALALVQAEHLSQRSLGVLSGGEQQRVMVALALTRRPQLLILDEPASGVDIRGEMLLCELLERLRGPQGFTQLMVSHDLSLVTAHASHVICLNHRVLGQGPPDQALRPEVLQATFGIHLGLPDMRAWPPGRYPSHGPHEGTHDHG